MTTATAARPYQLRAVDQLRAAVKTHSSAVYVLPTGGGKTVVAGMIARGVIAKGGQLLFIVHRRELIKQALGTLQEASPGLQIGVEAPGWPSMPWAPLHVGMVQSLARRDYVRRMRPAVIVIDEAHHARASTWEKVLAWWPDTARVGLTATPERLDGKGLSEHFATMIQGPTVHALVEDGFLAPCRTLTIPLEIDTTGLRANRRGEYGAKISERITDKVVADAADAYVRYARGGQAIFFGEDRNHSRRVVEHLNAMGVKASHVDGTDHAARRDRVMQEFRNGTIQVVGNCDLISEGFDAPSCDVVMMGKKTKSITRYLQQAGRAMRPRPGKEALILDLAGNSYLLGLPDETREWKLEDGEVQEEEGERKLRVCQRCRTAFYGGRCPHCSYQPPMPDVEEQKVDLIEAQGKRPRKPRSRRSELWAELAQAYKQPDPAAAIVAIGQRRGYKPGWAKAIISAKGLG